MEPLGSIETDAEVRKSAKVVYILMYMRPPNFYRGGQNGVRRSIGGSPSDSRTGFWNTCKEPP